MIQIWQDIETFRASFDSVPTVYFHCLSYITQNVSENTCCWERRNIKRLDLKIIDDQKNLVFLGCKAF